MKPNDSLSSVDCKFMITTRIEILYDENIYLCVVAELYINLRDR